MFSLIRRLELGNLLPAVDHALTGCELLGDLRQGEGVFCQQLRGCLFVRRPFPLTRVSHVLTDCTGEIQFLRSSRRVQTGYPPRIRMPFSASNSTNQKLLSWFEPAGKA